MIYHVDREPYGLRVTFDATMDERTASQFRDDFLQVLETVSGPISILIDLRRGGPISPRAQEYVATCYHAVDAKGLIRSANIVSSALMKLQMVRRAKELGTYEKVRYIDPSTQVDFEKVALEWLEKGIDPDRPTPVRS